VFEDEQLLVVNKPAGLAVHGGSGVSYGLIEAIRRIRGDGVELAHRLDRDTSGCLLLAKRRSALRTLHELIRQGRLHKRYRLIVSGQWPRDLETVKLPLHKYHTGSGERRVRVAAEGKPSHTDFHLVERCDRASLLDADLITGRTHQIRVHAQASGHPLIGDQKYATDEQLAGAAELGISRLCLHAERVIVPWAGDSLTFICPVPAEMQQAWQRLQAPST
jgi:23S rRNA pseudouridine955/2504/2580 synthase